MRAVIQRVLHAQVHVEGEVVGKIDKGLLVYLSVGKGDGESDAAFMAAKITELRIFADEGGKMNRNVREAAGQVLLISQFTLHGDCRKGRRPGFDQAAEPHLAKRLYEQTIAAIGEKGITVETGVFAATMQVVSTNDGPATFLLDSGKLF